MHKLLSLLLPVLAISSAFAQAEPPTEKADPFTVVIFLVLFVGSIAGYFVYIWWKRKNDNVEKE